MNGLKQHPLSAAFPAMSADDFAALVADIKANGQREPVVVYEGMVLDGWHRYCACIDAGMKPHTMSFPVDGDPVALVKSANLHRRHMTASQRAAAVVACSAWVPAGRPKKGAPSASFSTKAELAKEAHVSQSTIAQAKVAHKAGLAEAVTDGGLTAKEAASVARGIPEPAKKAKREVEPPPADDDNLAEAQHTITELAEENEQLRDKLAVESLMGSEEAKTQTAETIRELRALVRTLEAENAALKVARDTYQRESSEAKKAAMYWRKQAEKAAKDAA